MSEPFKPCNLRGVFENSTATSEPSKIAIYAISRFLKLHCDGWPFKHCNLHVCRLCSSKYTLRIIIIYYPSSTAMSGPWKTSMCVFENFTAMSEPLKNGNLCYFAFSKTPLQRVSLRKLQFAQFCVFENSTAMGELSKIANCVFANSTKANIRSA